MVQQSLNQCLRLARRCATRQYSSSAPSTISVANLLQSPSNDEERQVYGFVRSIRKQKLRAFATIGDGSSLEPLQALLTPDQAHSLSTGTAVCLRGHWRPSPNANVQSHELHVNDLSLLGPADPATYPLQKKYHSPEYLRTMPHIRGRIPFNSLMLQFRSKAIAQLTDFFAQRDFVQTHPPIITSSDCEGAGEVFDVGIQDAISSGNNTTAPLTSESNTNFFKSPKYLTVSSQLHLEAFAQSVGKVWTLSPTFRAEKSDTPRHLSEFYMLEAEINFVDRLDEVMSLVEDMLRNLTTQLHKNKVVQEIIHGKRNSESRKNSESIVLSEELERRWQGMMRGPWPRITYTKAIEILQQSNQAFNIKPTWGIGLQAEHERYIASKVGQGQPVFVTTYPQNIKAFYMLPSNPSKASGPTVECFDLLVPEICEIAGGSMREHRLTELLEVMHKQGMIAASSGAEVGSFPSDEALGSLKWYIDLRRWGSVPHGGFGLGFDRLLGYLAGVQNIREVVAFPRWFGRCDC